jgi:signal transduction histidine kinase/ligand-binding sensor domain-containing protein
VRSETNSKISCLAYSVLVRALLFLCATSLANGVDANRKISQYGHTAWRVQDGTISPGTSIAQTTDGYLWLGTSEGLLRFDGVRFVRWQPPKGQSLPGTHFSALFGAHDGSLWIGTTRGLSRWKDGQLRTYADSAGPASIAAIIEDDEGTIWVTRYGRYARETPLCSISRDTFRCFGQKDGIPVNYGLGLARDNAKNLWFGSTVLCRWKPGAPATTFFHSIAGKLANGDGVVDVALGPSGTVWATLDAVGAQLGVQQYSAGRWSSYIVPGFDGEEVRSHALLVDRQGSLWVGTENDGIYRINAGVADHYTSSDGLTGNSVVSFFEDREGNVWVRTDGGLDMFRDTAIISYTTRQGLPDSSVASVMASRNGAVWIATESALTILEKKNGLTVLARRELLNHDVGAMLEDHTGAVWLGVDKRLVVFRNEHFREIRRHDGLPIAAHGQVKAISEDVTHVIWVLTSGGQLFRVVGDEVQEASLDHLLDRPLFLAADANGGLWLATKGSLFYYRDGHLQDVRFPDPNGPADVHALVVDIDNSVLVSTSEGLYRLKDGRLSALSIDNGLSCRAVLNAIRDSHRSLWIYTQCGLLRIGEAEWAKWIENPHRQVSFTTFDAMEGAHAGTGSPLQPASSKAPDGRLWFLSGISAQVIDPDHLYDNTPPPPLNVEAVIADHKPLRAGSSIAVPARTRDLEIDYTALSFSAPQKVKFRYMLEGYDREWQEAGTRRQAFYTTLVPGSYRFRVTACNSDGVWNEAGTFLDFSVLPAYYQTAWFRFACGCILALLSLTLYQMRVRRLHRQFEIGLEARVGERTRIARELHDTLLQSFQGVLLQFQAASNLLPTRPQDAKERLENSISDAAKAIAEGRDAVHQLRSPSITTNDLASDLSVLASELRVAHGSHIHPDVSVEVEGVPQTLHPTARDEIYRIGSEALRNAFRHSSAEHVEVEFRYGKRELRLRIRDDGKGMDPALPASAGASSHWGLPGMSERAKLLKGTLNVWSERGRGTEVELSIPASVAYLNSGATPWRRLMSHS